jgi:RNA polymerase sigma-70 factor (sigma-E family)
MPEVVVLGHVQMAPTDGAAPGSSAAEDFTAEPEAVSTVAALFRDHHGELVRLALLLVGDLPTAEDIVQDVYANLHTRWRRAAGDAPLPYVRAAVLNGCRSVLRRQAIARRAGALHRAPRQDGTLASAESQVILSEDRRQVLAALARLPRRRREVLILRYYLGLSEAEIAAVLGISPGTVKSTAARALAALARDLGEMW